MSIDFLTATFEQHAEDEAVIWQDQSFSYRWLLEELEQWRGRLSQEGLAHGSIVSLEADFSPASIVLMMALIERRCTVVPLTSSVESKKDEFLADAQVERRIRLGEREGATFESRDQNVDHELLVRLRDAKRPGLVLFSSGSTGKSKAAVHDFLPMLEKYHVKRHALRTITFLLFDHIGGVNTLFYVLANGGCVIALDDRTPDAVCTAIERHRAQLLPTSPTFLNLLLVSRAYERHDLSSLELITYGTEPMTEGTLKRLHELFPDVRLLQTYGLSEVGILRSKSRSSDSLWVKVGGEGFETRIVDGKLEIKAKSAMLGYLNAPSPFTEDGWFQTGDAVEVDGDYLRILGRESEIINVGGEKVYPAEVEDVLQQIEGVAEAVVTGEPNAITGQMVMARVRLSNEESLPDFRRRLRQFCKGRLERYKIPQKIELVEQSLHGERFKKSRRL